MFISLISQNKNPQKQDNGQNSQFLDSRNNSRLSEILKKKHNLFL